MRDLLDANVWVSLIDPRHVHHAVSVHYWEQQAAGKIAFTRVTMLAMLRLSTGRHVLQEPLAPTRAWEVYRRFRSLPFVEFVPEPEDIEERYAELTESSTFPNHLWTDAYLAAVALSAHCRVVTFDTDFQRFRGLDLLLLAS